MKQCAHGRWDYEADIIIIGFGGAGGCAAIEAHNAGSEVILLEKQPEESHYSNTRMSGGGYHSPDPSGDRKALKAYAQAMFSGENIPWKFEGEQPEFSEGLAEMWAQYAPQNAAFMCSLDPDYVASPAGEAAYPDLPGAKESGYRNCNSTYSPDGVIVNFWGLPKSPKNKKEAGEAFHACILHGVTGREIPVHYNTRAMKLLKNDDEEIIGVQAEHSGRAVFYRARKAVIITSGGFEYNKALRSAFLDGYAVDGWAFYGTPANTGDGIIMGLEVGAALSKVGSAAARLIGSFPEVRTDGIRMGIAIVSIGRPGAIVVDNSGVRFCDERDVTRDPIRYISYRHALAFDVHQAIFPRTPSWFILDEAHRTQWHMTTTNATEYFGIPWSEDNHEPIEKGWILKADTIEALAEQIRLHPDNKGQMDTEQLAASVRRFNEFCAHGADKDYGRDFESMGPIVKPPFYALPLFPGGPNTKGGLKANEKRQVVDWAGQVIPRLYSAGEISSVFKYLYQAGGNVAECIVCGRVAAINAVKEPSWI
ncbi:MAG: FAD-binding protein [Oscillospiraceae bacterium]|nr:FAD-binding protein [Oscillospiraceae bacterium]